MSLCDSRERRTYFAVVDERYLKVGSSLDPFRRKFGGTKLPSDLRLDQASKRFIGAIPSVKYKEMDAHKDFRPWRVNGCREWYHWRPETERIIAAVSLQPVEWEPNGSLANVNLRHLTEAYGWKYAGFIARFAKEFTEECDRKIAASGITSLDCERYRVAEREIIKQVAASRGLR